MKYNHRRIAQLVFARIVKVNFENSSVLDETERSSSGLVVRALIDILINSNFEN